MVYPFAVVDIARVYPFFGLCKPFVYIGKCIGADLGNGERGNFHRDIGNLGSLLVTIQEWVHWYLLHCTAFWQRLKTARQDCLDCLCPHALPNLAPLWAFWAMAKAYAQNAHELVISNQDPRHKAPGPRPKAQGPRPKAQGPRPKAHVTHAPGYVSKYSLT